MPDQPDLVEVARCDIADNTSLVAYVNANSSFTYELQIRATGGDATVTPQPKPRRVNVTKEHIPLLLAMRDPV
jgi:hypothetical protein